LDFSAFATKILNHARFCQPSDYRDFATKPLILYFSFVEYSDISTPMAEATDESGALVYSAANIANHLFSTKFLFDPSGVDGGDDLPSVSASSASASASGRESGIGGVSK
jgi:hypothetical protein